jgi:hypothetical protein
MAKFKREVVLCSEEKGSCKATALFGVHECTFGCDGNTGSDQEV